MVERHWHGVRRYLRVLGAAADQADDLTQEAFLVALRKNIEDQGPATAAYLRRTARYLYLKTLRGTPDTALQEAHLVWEAECRDDEGAAYDAALRHCREQLTARAREALNLRYEAHASRATMAARLGMSEDGIKSLLRRTRAALAECIGRGMTAERTPSSRLDPSLPPHRNSDHELP